MTDLSPQEQAVTALCAATLRSAANGVLSTKDSDFKWTAEDVSAYLNEIADELENWHG